MGKVLGVFCARFPPREAIYIYGQREGALCGLKPYDHFPVDFSMSSIAAAAAAASRRRTKRTKRTRRGREEDEKRTRRGGLIFQVLPGGRGCLRRGKASVGNADDGRRYDEHCHGFCLHSPLGRRRGPRVGGRVRLSSSRGRSEGGVAARRGRDYAAPRWSSRGTDGRFFAPGNHRTGHRGWSDFRRWRKSPRGDDDCEGKLETWSCRCEISFASLIV